MKRKPHSYTSEILVSTDRRVRIVYGNFWFKILEHSGAYQYSCGAFRKFDDAVKQFDATCDHLAAQRARQRGAE